MIKLIGVFKQKLINENNDHELVFVIDSWVFKRSAEQLVKRDYIIEIKEPRDQRSLDQNRLFWVIVEDIAKETGISKDSVYAQLIEMAGAKFDILAVKTEAIPRLKEAFRAVVELPTLERSDSDMVNVKVFYGSSKMNKKEMSELIEKTLEYADGCGLDTAFYGEQLRGFYYD